MPSQISDYFLSDSAANKTGFRSEKRNIPFFDLKSRTIKVKLVYDKFEDLHEFPAQLDHIKRRATNRIMLHYFPEYYSAYRIDIRGKSGEVDNDTESFYQRVRTSINNPEAPRLTAVYYEPHSPALKPDKHIVLVTLEEFVFPLTKTDVEELKDRSVIGNATHREIERINVPNADETTSYITYSPKLLKEILELLEMLPPAEKGMSLFNGDEGIVATGDTTTLVIGSMMENNNLVNDGLASFQRQLNGFEGSLPINLDFNATQSSMMKILQSIVTELMKDLTNSYDAGKFTMSAQEVEFTDADLLILHFGTRTTGTHKGTSVMAGISYLVNEISQMRQPLKTGYMTNVLYNLQFNDPLVLATLKNYEMLVRTMELMSGPNAPNFSFLDFIQSTPAGDFGLPSNFVWDDLPTPVDTENVSLQEAAAQGVIDLADVKNLEKGFKLALSPKELKEYRQKVRSNPEVYKKVIAANKKKSLKAAMDITKGVEGVLEGNFPGIKKNSKLGLLLRKIGVDQLAKEAMICATFGMAPAFARLVKAVRGAIQKVGLQIYDEPGDPKPGLSMREINLDQFKIFSKDGDLWPQIKKMLIDTLMQSVLEIVKALAALLKELCKLNNPRAEDFGENDLADLVNNNLNNDAVGMPNITNQSALNPNGSIVTPQSPRFPPGQYGAADPLSQVFANDGFSRDQIMQYLRDLSAILSSMDICFLFMNRAEVPYETIEKIIDFNLEYPDLQIRTTLNTYSAIIVFFANLSRFVDLTDFCNEVANEIFYANIDNLCLLEEAAPDRIDELLQQLADGLIIPNPGGPPYNGAARPAGTFGPNDPGRGEGEGINLECPDRPGFIENPLFNDTIPNLLKTVIRVVETDFVNSVGAAQQALKEPGIASNASSNLISQTMGAAGVVGEGAEEMSKVARNILEKMQEVFATMGSIMDKMEETCDIGEILGLEAAAVQEVVEVIVDVMNELLNDPEFAAALADIENRLSDLQSQQAEGGGAPPAVSYNFPTDFTHKFVDYMPPKPLFDPRSSFTTMDFARTTELVKAGEFYSTTPGLYNPLNAGGSYSSYVESNLIFRFPTKAATQWAPVEGAFYGAGKVPRYERVPVDPANDVDALTIKFPKLSTIDTTTENSYIDISLKSKLLPIYASAMNFGTSTPPATSVSDTRDTNPYVALFTDELIREITNAIPGDQDAAQRSRYVREADTLLFPSAYGGLVESAFNYVRENGIFDINKLNSLNFFHDNANCLPEDVADLLDVSSILDELNDEMLDALCYDADSDGLNPMGIKIREVIRYGLFLLLIQIHVAQFIIKNIFVFSAFEIDHILGSPLVKEFMSITIREQVENYVRGHGIVKEKMVEYFNKKIKRPTTLQKGGLTNTTGDVIFPVGKVFNLTDFPAIVEYLTGNRIMNSKRPVSNAVKGASSMLNPKPFNKAFIEDILTIQPGWLGGWGWGDLNKDQAYIHVRQNPAIAPGSEWGQYQSVRMYMRNWSDNPPTGGSESSKAAAERQMLDHIRSLKDKVRTLPYGKLVLERQVTWDQVEHTEGGTVPPILLNTTGQDYGLEFDLFKSLLFDSRTRRAHGGDGSQIFKLNFTNLNLRYNVVYYLPESFDIPVEYTAEEIAAAFLGTDGIHAQGTIIDPGTLKPDPTGEEAKLFTEGLSNLIPPQLKMNFGDNISLYRIPLRRCGASIPLANEIATTQVEPKYIFAASSGQFEWRDVPVLRSQLGFYGETATNSELLALVMDPTFDDYFGKTFNKELITLIPVMHNFYLTTSFFPKFDKLLGAPKARCIEIFTDTVRNENAITDPRERPSPQALASARPGSEMEDLLSQSALEFILKMFIETPINILRGISEMMDPHVALSKIIRDITGGVFFQISEVIDATPPIEFLRGPNPDPEGEEGDTVPGIAPGISGEGVMKLLFCLLTMAMQASQQGFHLNTDPPEDPTYDPPSSIDAKYFLDPLVGPFIGNPYVNDQGFPVPPGEGEQRYTEGMPDPRDPRNNVPDAIKENFFPRITIEGVDFTGTFLGLLMLPPGPFGIVYLLLMLLKNALTEELEDALGDDGADGVSNVSEEESGSEC